MRFLETSTFCVLLSCTSETAAQPRFEDDFSGDLSKWVVVGDHAIGIRESNDPAHGRVLRLDANGNVQALVRGSDQWGAVRLEADILFPDDADNYLEIVYNYEASDGRIDFGGLYIKGNGSYIRANPWYDGNASRLLYEEYMTPLEGDDAVQIDAWHHIKAEIMGNVCHLYVGDMTTPKITFDLYHGTSGMMGFQPRIVGSPVWVDNVTITSIQRLSYEGPDIPAVAYEPSRLLTNWEVIGPARKHAKQLERSGGVAGTSVVIDGAQKDWRRFETDRRGGVVTGSVTQYDGAKPIAYFRAVVPSETERPAVLHVSTLDEIALWVNGRFEGFIYRDGYIDQRNDWNAWHDFWRDPAHAGRRVPIRLRRGDNVLMVRVRNGDFASGGFFARVEEQ